MNQSQEFKSPQQVLGDAKKVNRPDEYHELTHHNTNQQIGRGTLEGVVYTAYDAIEQRKAFQKQQKSYNEIREQYEEQAFSAETSVPVPGETVGSESSGDQPLSIDEGGESSQSESIVNTLTLAGSGTEWKSPSMQKVESTEPGDRMFGTAEVPELAKNTQALLENEKLQEKLEGRRKYVQKGYTRFTLGEHSTKEKEQFRYYGRLFDFAAEERELSHIGRLKYSGRVVREKMTQADYEEYLRRKEKKGFKRRTKGRLLFHGVKTVVDDETLSEDELTGRMKQKIRHTGRMVRVTGRKSIRTLKRQNNVYTRLEQAKQREQVLRNKRERLLTDAKRKQQKDQIRAANSRAQKRKLKKQMVQMRVREEGNFFRRTKQGFLIKRRAKKVRQQAIKRTLSTVFAISGLLFFFLILGIILFLILIAVFTGGTEYYASAVTQNDYETLTDVTGYYRKLETDLDEYLNADREALEAELEAEYGPDLYEYVYNLAEFGFSANTLMAYLSAVYGSFALEDVKAELEAIFEEMYTLTIEVKLEDRLVSEFDPETGDYEDVIRKKKICYVTLEKKELEEVVEERMTSDQLGQYGDYRLSTGGQQVYSPVMREDWTNLISSNFGERIHPITKERKVHNGVDIAIPVGTHLYSAVDGTVILARYSETAGNWVKVRTDTGWTVVMMHMDSLTVSEGQQVKKGDHLGYSGNTGRSTGPHLHLEVRDPSEQPMNPIFIIPQTCAKQGGGEN